MNISTAGGANSTAHKYIDNILVEKYNTAFLVDAALSPDKIVKLDTAHHVGLGISLPVNPGKR